MGRIHEYKCPSCHGVWKLFLGHGWNHGSIKQVLKVFSPELQNKIITEAKGDPDPLFLFNYQAALCKDCQNLVAVPVIQFLETKKTFVEKCPDCGGDAEILAEDSDIICPRCKKENLCLQEIGNWD